MKVNSWLGGFLEAYWPDRVGSPWPGRESADGRRTWSEWMQALIDARATKGEAEVASARLRERQIHLPSAAAHLTALIAEIGAIRSMSNAPVPGDRPSAEGQSRGCVHCEGQGLVTVYHPLHDGSGGRIIQAADGRRRTIPTRVMAHCDCPLGRWMRSKTTEDMLARIPMLADVLAGRSRWLAYDPTDGDEPFHPGR